MAARAFGTSESLSRRRRRAGGSREIGARRGWVRGGAAKSARNGTGNEVGAGAGAAPGTKIPHLRRFPGAAWSHPRFAQAKPQVALIALAPLHADGPKTCANEGKVKGARKKAGMTFPSCRLRARFRVRLAPKQALFPRRARRFRPPSSGLSGARLPGGSAFRARPRARAAPPRRSTRLCRGARRSARYPRSIPRPGRKARW